MIMTLDAIRRTKHETWCAGVEAFADAVHKCMDAAIEACEQQHIADAQPPSWNEVAFVLARVSTAIQKGRDVTFTLSPFLPMELRKAEAEIFRAFAHRPKTKDELSTSTVVPMKGDATNKRGVQKAAAPAKEASPKTSS